MSFTIKSVDVWVTDVTNRPGMLARVLEALRNAGANLDFVIARRVTANTSRVFVAPIAGRKQLAAAADVGLSRARGMKVLRIEGPDRAGLGADLTRALADQGINLRGVSAASIARKSVCYMAFEGPADAASAARIIRRALAKRR